MDKKSPIHMGVQTRWFTAIQKGKKTVEGRLYQKFASIKKGDTLIIRRKPESPNNGNEKLNVLVAVVTHTVRYPSFDDYLMQEGLARTLPGVRTISEGVNVYRAFYSESDEKAHGVMAIHIRVVN